jgi:hypothetical protein
MSRTVWTTVAVAAVGVVLASPLFGRAEVSGQYRPLLPPDGLTTGCYPLPGDVVPDFAYVLRHDGDMLTADGLRRRAVLQVDRVDATEAAGVLEGQLADAGAGDDVRISARDFDVADDAIVQGELVLDLPVVARQLDEPTCRDANSTKRFTPDLPDRS